jgi:hypothetical protein
MGFIEVTRMATAGITKMVFQRKGFSWSQNHECTTVAGCVCLAHPGDDWEPAQPLFLATLLKRGGQMLWKQGDREFYGWL